MLLVIVNAVNASVLNVKLSSVSMLPVAAMVVVVIPASTERLVTSILVEETLVVDKLDILTFSNA